MSVTYVVGHPVTGPSLGDGLPGNSTSLAVDLAPINLPVEPRAAEARLRSSLPPCTMCSRLASASDKVVRPEETVVEATPSYVAWPSVGSLVEGHLLVLPRSHHLAFAPLWATDNGELTELLRAVKARLTTVFNQDVYLFEHGPAAHGLPVGCSVDHAHLHLVPLQFDLFAAACDFEPALRWHPANRERLAADYASGSSYLYVELPSGDAWATLAVEPLPSQFFRRVIAERLKLDNYEWRIAPRPEVTQRTLRSLRRARLVRTRANADGDHASGS